jgi:hypothetical protein
MGGFIAFCRVFPIPMIHSAYATKSCCTEDQDGKAFAISVVEEF